MSSGGYSRHFVIVEGRDDSDFVGAVLLPVFAAGCQVDHVDVIAWANYTKDKRRGLIASIKAMNCEYTVLVDQDVACISERRAKVLERHPYLSLSNIIVVRGEIEAWYLAGATQDMLERLGWPLDAITDGLTKEGFREMLAQRGDDEALTKIRILREFNLADARRRAPSLEYLVARLDAAAG
jgi:hypothetical protein